MNTTRIFSASIAALATLLSGSHIGFAASATWKESGTNGNWNDPANWNPATVPNDPADIATFGPSGQFVPGATLSANTDVNAVVFNSDAPAHGIFTGNFTLTISGAGITNNSAAFQQFIADEFMADGASGVLRFQNSATAGSANVGVVGSNGGTVLFTGSSTGGAAHLIAGPNGSIDISGLATAGMTAGVIRDSHLGPGAFRLGSKAFTVGGPNLDFSVSSIIADGGTSGGNGGSIVKVGTGTMTYAGGAANTYTGTTFVNEGRLVLIKNTSIDAIRGPLVVGDGLGAASTAVLSVQNVDNIHNSQPVMVNGDGRFEVFGNFFESIGSLTVNKGNVSLPATTGFLSVLGPLAMTGGTMGGFGTIVLQDAAIQATSDSDGAAATISAPIFLPASTTYTFTVNDGPGTTDLLISGNLSGIFGAAAYTPLVKAGAGVMVLGATNSYDGSTTITAGTLSISSEANLGTAPNSPTANHLVFDSGTLRVTAGLTFDQDRGITLNAGGGTIEVTAGNSVTYPGLIAGTGGLTKTGPGVLDLSGVSSYTYTGTTAVNEGQLSLIMLSGAQAIAGPLVIGDGLGAANSAVVQLLQDNQISDTSPVTIQRDGQLVFGASVQDVIGGLTVAGGSVKTGGGITVNGALTMTGGTFIEGSAEVILIGNFTATSDASGLAATISVQVDLGGSTRTFTVNDGPGDVDLNITHPIINGGITKIGAGTLRLGGNNIYSGSTTIVAGKLVLSGIISNSTTVVANGATLQGTGTLGPLTVNSGGTLVPGLSVGTLTTGNLTLSAGSTSSFDLAVANVVGSGVNDLVAVNGDLVLGGTLAITTLPGFGPGSYPLFTYTNTAVDHGLAFESSFLAAHPGSTITLDAINKRVVANITALQALPGDYNQNGTVDAADYVVWRNGLGTIYTQNDYNVWRANFGRTAGSGPGAAGGAASSAVPEPATLLLLGGAAAIVAAHRRVD